MYQEQKKKVNLLIVKGTGTTLFGRYCLQNISLDWNNLNIHIPHPPDLI